VRKLTANPSSVSALLSYCALHGVELLQRTPYDDYITLQTTVGHWEELLNTEFYQFAAQSPPDTNAQPNTPDTYTPNTPYNPPPALFARALHYSLPLELSAHVRAVLNTVQVPQQAQGLGSQALYETIGQTFSPSDLAYFQQLFELPQ
ncbi:hypothetical protein B484DRAFT_403767, partial [Ochromonadaceae sp. CCMP2298]